MASLVTIDDWKTAQAQGGGLERLLRLVEKQAQAGAPVWITVVSPDDIKRQWCDLQEECQQQKDLALWGVPFAIKDNIDAAGYPTTAACPSFAGSAVAEEDAPVVARLKAAGAILVGKTNLDQFATGLVGTRSPYGAVPNAFSPKHVSGGSSSGSAVAVSQGVVPFALGTDTAGSGRVPAGLNNIIGLKPTRGALSTRGVVPACRTLDCVSVFAQTLEDAEAVLRVAEGFDQEDAYSRKRPSNESKWPAGHHPPTLAICKSPPWYGKTKQQEEAYLAALGKAERIGWKLVETDFEPLFALALLLYEGPWVAERYAAIRAFIEAAEPGDMDPTVRGIVLKAGNFSAVDAFDGAYRRQALTHEIEAAFADFDGLLVPTTPTFPTQADVAAEPVQENALLGTYTNFVNFLDWTALSVPAGFRADGLPFGVTLIARTWQEPRLLQLGRQWLARETRLLGAAGKSLEEKDWQPGTLNDKGMSRVSLVVVGAHLSGCPLNKDLVSRGAVLEQATTTSKHYRLFALDSADGIMRPGLKRVTSDGAAIQVEIWRLPTDQLASFSATIPHPLGLGSIELRDGGWRLGFVCEPIGFDKAVDITGFGGWRAYTASLSRTLGSVLVANRGEIAVRIIRTLHKMGLRAVAVYADDDAQAPHVHLADVACRLEGASVAETYLNGARIVELAVATAADAIIPGYGFLAENADFAAAVEAAGLVWIGPTPEQIRQLGHKHTARALAVAAGVPVVPGSESLLRSVDEAKAAADVAGYPVMLKSTAGGGGIGLRRCDDEASLVDALTAVQRLAQANFGDDGVFLEHYVAHARHVEIQVLGDGTGRVLAAGSRDCSLQRRHQKVLEEAPALHLSEAVAVQMRVAAIAVAAAVQYRNVGTVEFIYDVDTTQFFFLEVNTRLQVEHTVTEAVTGLDLVECMVHMAAGEADSLFARYAEEGGVVPTAGAAVEARVYAESPLQAFRPSRGRILDVQFPEGVRIDTWVASGTEMASSYDSLVAKIVATGDDRQHAIDRLAAALASMRITGLETNVGYLQHIVTSDEFRSGRVLTSSLDSLEYAPSALEVVDPGTGVSVQDYPGRKGYWHAGIPPSGPMDDYSFRLANRLVGNPPTAAALECSFQGPTLRFHADVVVAVTGADGPLQIEDQPAAHSRALTLKAGQTLSLGTAVAGCRTYVAVRGGIDVPLVLGSRSTFELGKFGGHNGRKLVFGDILHIGQNTTALSSSTPLLASLATPIPKQPHPTWTVGVIPGPHGAPDYFTSEGLGTLFAADWAVHYNSNRLGVRLTGPRPQWARRIGGEAGLHPSNIHDSPYSVGSVSFTGDEAVVLACDGPSLGGFVVWCVVAQAEMWKLGQVRPGDRVRFAVMTMEEAGKAANAVDASLEELTLLKPVEPAATTATIPCPIIGRLDRNGSVVVRQAGDNAMLLEFGEHQIFDLRQSLAIHGFLVQHQVHPIPGVEELTPGVRTLHVLYARGTPPAQMMAALAAHEYSVSSSVRTRRIHLPLAFDDVVCRQAVQRYSETIRDRAPWLPNNADFLQQLNGLEAGSVEAILSEAECLVLGLGDVFMGSPCAVPLDPRHRLFGTKYNPSRSFTPQGAVGIGGQYLCIYAGESPGGYQLVGRTAPIWADDKLSYVYGDTEKCKAAEDPWLFRLFDRISFYPVDEAQLGEYGGGGSSGSSSLIHIEEDVELDLEKYEAWLEENKDDIAAARQRQDEAIAKAPFFEELLRPYDPASKSADAGQNNLETTDGEKVRALMPGKCFKCQVQEGYAVCKGDALIWMESNKMEIKISSPRDGRIVKRAVKEGEIVEPGRVLFVIE